MKARLSIQILLTDLILYHISIAKYSVKYHSINYNNLVIIANKF